MTDLAPLARLGALRCLDLRSMEPASLAPLRGLRSLRLLKLARPAEAPEEVDLNFSQVKRADGLEGATALAALSLVHVPIGSLPRLETLRLAFTRIQALPGLAARGLREVDGSYTGVKDLRRWTG